MSSLPSPQRRPWWPLVVSVLLLILFGVLAAHQIQANRERLATNKDLLAELAEASIVEENAPTSQEWPQWRGPNRDGWALVDRLAGEWQGSRVNPIWVVDGSEGYSSLVVKDDRAYTLSVVDGQEGLVCLNAVTGGQVWRQEYKRPTLNMQYGYTPRSTPTLDGDRIYSVGTSGQLQCRTVAAGELVWEHDLMEEYGVRLPTWGMAFSPLVVGDLLITVPGGSGGRSVVAFDKKDGKERWRALDDPAGYSSPILIQVAGRPQPQLVVFTGKNLCGLTLQGKVLWNFPWPTNANINAATPLTFQAQANGKTHTYVFIASGYGKGCALLRIEPNAQGGSDVQSVYESNQMCCRFSSPVRYQDLVFGFSEDLLTCMDIKTGAVKWTRPKYHHGSVTMLRDAKGTARLLVLGEEGHLALFDPEKEQPLSEVRPTRNKCWAPPAVAQGRLYMRTQGQVLRLELPNEKTH